MAVVVVVFVIIIVVVIIFHLNDPLVAFFPLAKSALVVAIVATQENGPAGHALPIRSELLRL